MTNERSPASMTQWLAEPLPADVSRSLDRLARLEDVRQVAVMPDVHLAGDVCNGTVIATRDLIYPQAVGGDIGCGMLAVACDLPANVLASDELMAGRVLAGLNENIPANKHGRTHRRVELPAELRDRELSTKSLQRLKQRDGLFQLGTLGRGNHFVEFQSDDDGRLWLMLHTGSRGLGQAITEHHLRLTQSTGSGLGWLSATTSTGQAYLSDLEWAIEYAMQNRLVMAQAVAGILQSLFEASLDWSTLIHCQHNHVARERHADEDLWVHRKGALPADVDVPGVIPGSMGNRSFHVAGRGATAALRSSSHGAGRMMARHQARQKISQRDLDRQMQDVWFDRRLADKLRDEAPGAYKEIGRVMRAQRELTRIVRELRPVLVYKGV